MTRNLEAAKAKAGDLGWSLAWASGHSMPLAEVQEYALSSQPEPRRNFSRS